MLIDTHCHLDFPEFDQDRDEVVRRASLAGVERIVNVGSSLEGSRRAVELARTYKGVYASVGIHPHEADDFRPEQALALRELAKEDKVVAIGEIGLDYYRNYSRRENQKPLFTALVTLAKDLDLPLVIHSRQAQADTLGVLKEYLPIRAVVHCFSGGPDFLRDCLGLGFFVSFTCNVTYDKAADLRELVKEVPLERMFLETDAPFLPPEGRRGMRNEPCYVKELAVKIAELKQMGVEELARVTTSSAAAFFNLK
ncbi:MAG: TatD family hydrolase [Candidatus Omnitrophota bacterium]